MSSKRITITSRHDLTERTLLFDEHFDERVKLAFELDSNVFLYYYNGTTKISEFGVLSDGEKLSFSTEDIPDGIYTDIENAVKNGRAKRVNAEDKRKFKQLEQTANSLYSNQQSEPSPQIIKSPKGRVGRQQKPLDITGAPGYEKLGEDEKTLCTALRLTPQLYLDIKAVLTAECAKQGYLKKQQARSLIKIDVNKTAAIFDFLQEHGWINNNTNALIQQQTHHLSQHHTQQQQQSYLPAQQPQQPQQPSFLQQENYLQQHDLIQNQNPQQNQQQQQQVQTPQQPPVQQQRLSFLPQQTVIVSAPKFKQEHIQQPPTKKVKRENPSLIQQSRPAIVQTQLINPQTIPKQQQQQQQQPLQSNNNGQQQQSNQQVFYERVFVSYQTKGNTQHPVFYAIPQPTHPHLLQQTNSHIVGHQTTTTTTHLTQQQQQHANQQHGSNPAHHHQQQQQFSSNYTTPQSDDNIQHPPQDSSSGEEPVLDLWDPAALQNADQDHWGSVLDVQARDSMNIPGFNPNYPQANLPYTQYVPDDVANLPFPTSHQ